MAKCSRCKANLEVAGVGKRHYLTGRALCPACAREEGFEKKAKKEARRRRRLR
jgi:hypothetical protein